MNSANGIQRNGSPVTSYRPSQLPFSLEHRLPDEPVAEFSREKLALDDAGSAGPFRLFAVRLCPRAKARISAMLAVPHLHPEVRTIYLSLLKWATD